MLLRPCFRSRCTSLRRGSFMSVAWSAAHASLDLSMAAFAEHKRQNQAVQGKHFVAGPVRRNSRRRQPAGGSGLGVTPCLLHSLLDCYVMRCLDTSGNASCCHVPRHWGFLPWLTFLEVLSQYSGSL